MATKPDTLKVAAWFDVVNSTATDVEVNLFGEVGYSFGASEVISNLQRYAGKDIELNLFSFGGNAFEAFAITDFIKNRGAASECRIYGVCGSAATPIALACDRVLIGENSAFFVHNAFHVDGLDDSETAVKLNEVNERLAKIYSDKTGIAIEEIRVMMQKETLLFADKAIELGFCDGKLSEENAAIAACLNNLTINNMSFLKKLKAVFSGIPDDTAPDGDEKPVVLTAEEQAELDDVVAFKADFDAIKASMAPLKATMEAAKTELEAIKAEGERLKEEAKTVAAAIVAQAPNVVRNASGVHIVTDAPKVAFALDAEGKVIKL